MRRLARREKPLPEHDGATAGVVVKVIPIGGPGQVTIAIYDAGPLRLSRDEAVRVLEAAVARLRDDPTWPLPGQTEAGG